jgi:hypothetical protein
MNTHQLSHTEKLYLENEEFNKNNQEEVEVKVDKAAKFRKENGYSITMDKLMKKWNCESVEAYRALRRKHQKENYIGPKREKKAVETTTSSFLNSNRNNNRNNYKNNNKRNINKK